MEVMNIELTPEQYRRLVTLVHLGLHVSDTFDDESDAEREELEKTASLIYSKAPEFEAGDLVHPEPEDGIYYTNEKLEDMVEPYLDRNEGGVFWFELTHQLAARDPGRAMEEGSDLPEGITREELFESLVSFYSEEFEAGGLENLYLFREDDADEPTEEREIN